ncbi:SPT3 Dosage dependent suppressor of Ty-induced promoter mutations-like protein [Physocladia obscura]|uniref:SPT3 Dosage dependent suppressor of Ty-induced promoter mutations-like protein n=1 Tax=Physocladia obscura TaxID=109957 RepID=A0AAD5T0D0_9FUNG|nr:SPT3 Dosage dependent suppressor of Ty-induced promoter mutations-like protein [Physocladia obscura]
MKEIPLQETIYLLRKSGRTLLAADASTYKLINDRNGAVTPLFPYDRTLMKPIVCAIGPSEFLLAFATANGIGLGMFVNSNGDAVRGTIQWSALPKSIVFQFPYTIALLNNKTIEIHELFSQRLVQTVELTASEFIDPRFLHETNFPLTINGDADDRDVILKILVVCSNCVAALPMKSLDSQIRKLLAENKPANAVMLAENSQAWSPELKIPLQELYERAGIAFFYALDFDDALRCFKKGDVDPHLILDEFGEIAVGEGQKAADEFLGKYRCDSNWIREVTRHKNGDVAESYLEEAFRSKAIIAYMIYARTKEYAINCFELSLTSLQEIDNFLLVVYEQADTLAELYSFLLISNNLDISKAEEYLRKRERFHALAILFKGTNQERKFLELCLREYEDEEFDGESAVIEYLANMTDIPLFLEFVQRIFVIDPALGTQALIKTRLELEISQILAIVENYGDSPLMEYLESVLNAIERPQTYSRVQYEELSGRLQTLYLNDILKLYDLEVLERTRDEYVSLLPPRSKFLEYLSATAKSNTLVATRAKLLGMSPSIKVLEKIAEKPGFAAEKALVFQRQGNVRDAVRIWVTEVFDYASAEDACATAGSGGGDSAREAEFQNLVAIYLEGWENKSVRSYEYSGQAVSLLNRYPWMFNMAEIIRRVPSNWSVSALGPFFMNKLRTNVYEKEKWQVQKSLVKVDNFKTKAKLVGMYDRAGPIIVGGGTGCVVCQKELKATELFVRVEVEMEFQQHHQHHYRQQQQQQQRGLVFDSPSPAASKSSTEEDADSAYWSQASTSATTTNNSNHSNQSNHSNHSNHNNSSNNHSLSHTTAMQLQLQLQPQILPFNKNNGDQMQQQLMQQQQTSSNANTNANAINTNSNNAQSMMAAILRSRGFPNAHFLHPLPPPTPSVNGFSLDGLKRQLDAAYGYGVGLGAISASSSGSGSNADGKYILRVLGVPLANARSRVETQTKLCLQMADARSGCKASVWSHLRLPELLVTKEKTRKVVDYSLIPINKVLDLQAVVVCASDPKKDIHICRSCQMREAKRNNNSANAKKLASSSSPPASASLPSSVMPDSDVKMELFDSVANQNQNLSSSFDADSAKIVLFNCASYVDFSSGDTILPTRVTCYCRHHNEKLGFCIYFIARDHNSKIVATGISPPILITDDHKGTKSSKGATGQKRPRAVASALPIGDDILDSLLQEPTPTSPPNPVLRPYSNSHVDINDDIIAQFIPALLASESNAPLFENFGIKSTADPDQRRAKKKSTSAIVQSAIAQPSVFVPPITVINRIIPGEGPIQGGVEITILGDNIHNGLIAVFGDLEAITTQVWGTSTMICILPPSSTPGPVPVTLRAIPGFTTSIPGTPNIPVTFMYKDDLDRSLMELALQVVGLRMTGSLDSARNIAMRIVNETAQQDINDNSLTFTELARSQLETAVLNALFSLEEYENETLPHAGSSPTSHIVLTSLLDMTYHPSSGLNMIQFAALANMTMLVKYLIAIDCAVDVRDKNGFTALMFAVQAGNREVIRILLQADASHLLTSKNNVSCFTLAARRGVTDFKRLLKELDEANGVDDLENELEQDISVALAAASATVTTRATNTAISAVAIVEEELICKDPIGHCKSQVYNMDVKSADVVPDADEDGIVAEIGPSDGVGDAADFSVTAAIEELCKPAIDFKAFGKSRFGTGTANEEKEGTAKKLSVAGKMESGNSLRWTNPEEELKNIMDRFKLFSFLGPLVHTIANPLIVQRADVAYMLADNAMIKEVAEKPRKQSSKRQQQLLNQTVSVVPFSGYTATEGRLCTCDTWNNGLGTHKATCAQARLARKIARKLKRKQMKVWLFWLPLITVAIVLALFWATLTVAEVDALVTKILTWNDGVVSKVKGAYHGLQKESKSMVFDFLNTGFGEI